MATNDSHSTARVTELHADDGVQQAVESRGDEPTRNTGKVIDLLLVGIGFAMFAYHMLSTQYLFFGAYEHQNLHLAFTLVLLFLNGMRNAKSGWGLALQALLVLLSLVGTIYVYVYMGHLEQVIGYPERVDL